MSERYWLPGIDTHVELTRDDYWMLRSFVGESRSGGMRYPDEYIGARQDPYLFRWRLNERGQGANIMVHVQVRSDSDRGLHDHPWDNTTVVLSGGYNEQLRTTYPIGHPNCGDVKYEYDNEGHSGFFRQLRKGDVVFRQAKEAHRLILPAEIPYTITLFTTGPKIREWGFYMPEGWKKASDVFKERDY